MNHLSKWRLGLCGGVLAAGFVLPPSAVAQDAGGSADAAQQAQERAGRRGRGQGQGSGAARNPTQAVDQWRQDVNALKLRDEQKGRLDAVFKEAGEQAKSLETELQSIQPRERAEKLQPFMRDLRRNVFGVLDEEQRQELRRSQGARQGRMAAERYRRATADLNLSGDQQTKVDALLADMEKKAGELAARAGDNAAGGAGAASPDGGGRGQGQGGAMATLSRETREKLNAILTAEQRQKFDERMQPRRRGQRGAGAAQ